MHFILRLLGIAVAVFLTVNLVQGISISGGWLTVSLVVVVWSVINTVIKPVLSILTLPINILTLGFFTFIVNALLFWGMAFIVPGFSVAGFFPALFGSIILSLSTWLILKIIPN